MQWGTQTYRAGALERLEDARILIEMDSPRCALSVYSAGVAVEGMLRALIAFESKEFDEKHDLRKLAGKVEQLGLLRLGSRDDDFVSQIQQIARVWHNALRYAAEDQVARHFRRIKVARNLVPGEIRRVCGDHFERCSGVVRRCEALFSRRKKGR